jgi:hypothetical protein
MLHEDNVMEKVKSVDAVEFTAADKKAMTHAGHTPSVSSFWPK